MREPKKLPVKDIKKLAKELEPPPQPPKIEKVKIGKPPTINVTVTFLDTVWLLIKSVVRNKARDAMEGKDVQLLDVSRAVAFIGGLKWMLPVAVAIALVVAVLFFGRC